MKEGQAALVVGVKIAIAEAKVRRVVEFVNFERSAGEKGVLSNDVHKLSRTGNKRIDDLGEIISGIAPT